MSNDNQPEIRNRNYLFISFRYDTQVEEQGRTGSILYLIYAKEGTQEGMMSGKGKESERSRLLDDEENNNYRDIKEELAMQTRLGMNQDFTNPNEAKVESISMVGIVINLIFFVCLLPILVSFYTVRLFTPRGVITLFTDLQVQPQQHALIVFMGSLVAVVTTPGLHW